jgi:hypothetical protein
MFTQQFGNYVCVGDSITCSVDGFEVKATIYRDDCGDKPDERDDGFWPSRDKTAAGYVLPENYESEMAKAQRVMKAWLNDDWFYCGVAVTVSRNDVELTQRYNHALWGIECNSPDSDNDYLRDVANELLSEAIDDAKAVLANLCAA